MSGTAFYNEHDPFAAAWLRELISDGHIAPGIVDERSIEDLTPDDLRPFRQVHFFAGVGVWSLAARIAGIPDDAPLWTGSCPCQPFSAAGQGKGFADERHLWPAFHYLIEQCRPDIVVGEQVAGAGGDAWLDAVQADMEATDYAFGAVETVACGFGAPHKRSRNYWVANRDDARLEGRGILPECAAQFSARSGSLADRLADAGSAARERNAGTLSGTEAGIDSPRVFDGRDAIGHQHGGANGKLANPAGERHDGRWTGEEGDQSRSIQRPERLRDALVMADADGRLASNSELQPGGEQRQQPQDSGAVRCGDSGTQSGPTRRLERPGPTNGFWRDADWLRCRDEKWRPVEPGTFPLADAGAFRNRVGLIRGAGNAVTLGQAVGFLNALLAA